MKRLLMTSSIVVLLAACADFDGYRLREDTSVNKDGTEPTNGAGSSGALDGNGETSSSGGNPNGGSSGGSSGGGTSSNGGTSTEDAGTHEPQPGDVTCHADADGDGIPAKAGAKVFNPSCGAGWLPPPTNGKFDCADDSANAYPGQSGYFVTATPSGSFDYDCDGIEAKDVPYVLDCGSVIFADCSKALYVWKVNNVLPNSVADIKCGASIHAYRCKLDSGGNCAVNEGNSVARTVACK